MKPQISMGRTVRYVLANGQERPAIVTQVHDVASGCVNLTVFTESQDVAHCDYPIARFTSVLPSDEPKAHFWHWPTIEPQ